jgi:chromosome partitioning protein
MISILVINSKGGCGKSTIATNLASAFAGGGLTTALADSDRQRSSLRWTKARPSRVATVHGIDWTRRIDDAPANVSRLIIDAQAALRPNDVRDLVRLADVVIVPVLPSTFDIEATRRFVRKLEKLKPIRKRKKTFGVVCNRVQPRSRSLSSLEDFVAGTDSDDLGRIRDRALYPELVTKGLGLFDVENKRARELWADWMPLIDFIERTD